MSQELPPLAPHLSETVLFFVLWAITMAVAVASFRRSRCLSRYSVVTSLAIAALAGAFWLIWIIVSIAKRKQLARDWSMYRRNRAARDDLAMSS